jgi:hypothetical protein
MAKCDLSIDLDEPDRVYRPGETVTGTLHVLVDADVRCKGLEIQSGWRTHGRGNVARGTTETVTLFSGEWTAGQRESYRFELSVADWPPSYHGNYINVDHYVDARAKIPWAFDPKASAEFVMRPTSPPQTDGDQQVTEIRGCFGTAIAGFILIAILMAFGAVTIGLAANPWIALVFAAIAAPIVLFLVGKFLLPRWLLGNVEAELQTPQVAPGGKVRAKLAFRPKRRVTINRITAELTGSEVCISGSGSNRTTHRNKFFSDVHVLQEAATLRANERQDFEFEFPVPDDVPYSFDLNDNDLNWTVELRVDIPRWPDWTKSLKLQVYPDGGESADSSGRHRVAEADADPGWQNEPPSEDSITFAETAAHLWSVREDDEQVDLLVDAVTGLTFDIDTQIERRLLYSGPEDPDVYPDGYAVWARYIDPPLPLALYVPHELGDEFEQAGSDNWTVRGTIIGWDRRHGRLQIKVLPR